MKKTFVMYMVVLLQSILAISVGSAILNLISDNNKNVLSFYLTSFNSDISDKLNNINTLKEYYDPILMESSFSIVADDGKEFSILFKELDVSIDYDKIYTDFLRKGFNVADIDSVKNFSSDIKTQFILNQGKLKNKLEEISSQVNKSPTDACVELKDSNCNIEIIPETIGKKLNIEKTMEKIKNQIDINAKINLTTSEDGEIQLIKPLITSTIISDIDSVIAEYSQYIPSYSTINSVKDAANSINKTIIHSNKKSSANYFFSFLNSVKNHNKIFYDNDEGYNQTASTLFGALLISGIGKENISRTPHKTLSCVNVPGIDVVINNSTDFTFTNSLECNIAIFSGVSENKIWVKIAGNHLYKNISNELKTENIKNYSNSTIYIQKKNITKRKIISKGIEGKEIAVYLYNKDSSEKKLLHTDIYKPVDEIIQIPIDDNESWSENNINYIEQK